MKLIIPLCLMLTLFSACFRTKPIDIELPETEKKLVISSVVIPGDALGISVSYSFSALTNKKDSMGNLVFDSATYKQFLAEHARVTVKYGGHTDTLFKTVPGIYLSTKTLQVPNESYTLEVYDSSTWMSVSAHSTMLPRVDFDTLYFTKTRTAKDTTVDVHFTINDADKSRENYYMVSYYNQKALPFYNTILNDPDRRKYHVIELYNDKNVDQYGRIKIDKPVFVPSQNDFMIVEMASISKGYYEFLTAYQRTDLLIYQVLGEPVTLPTNIIGGYGYFSTFNPVFRLVDLSKL